jgi:hypothetical protein
MFCSRHKKGGFATREAAANSLPGMRLAVGLYASVSLDRLSD